MEKIVWLDMGMMGRLTPRDKSLIAKAVKAIARGNNSELVDVILALGIFMETKSNPLVYRY